MEQINLKKNVSVEKLSKLIMSKLNVKKEHLENESDLKFIGSDNFFKDLCVDKFSVLIFESLYSFFTIGICPT